MNGGGHLLWLQNMLIFPLEGVVTGNGQHVPLLLHPFHMHQLVYGSCLPSRAAMPLAWPDLAAVDDKAAQGARPHVVDHLLKVVPLVDASSWWLVRLS